MKEEYYKEVVQKAVQFIKNNLAEPLTLAQIAKSVGYSESRLKSIFNDYSEHGVQAHILSLRMERAKHLLSQTKLGIAEIAFESGFNSHEQFCRFFQKRVGLSPSAFRSNSKNSAIGSDQDGSGGNMKEWVHEAFEEGYSTKNWGLDQGKISFENGFAQGEADELFILTLKRALPENFEFSMEFQPLWENDSAHFFLALHGEPGSASSYQVVLDNHDQQVCMVKQMEVARQIRPFPAVARLEWARVRARLHDDTLWVLWNDQELLKFQSDFPFPYNSRSRLSLRSWRSRVRFRNVQIRDLGFPPMVRGIRQGDALYNAEDFIAARSFYQRLLETDASFGDTMELYYKIGMCFLAQRIYPQARSWLHRAASRASETVWAQRARIWLIHLNWLENQGDPAAETATAMKDPAQSDEVRMALQKACSLLHSRGDFKKSATIHRLLLDLDETAVLPIPLRVNLAEELQWTNDLAGAEQNLRHVIDHSKPSSLGRMQALHDLSFVYSVLGRFADSEACCRLIREETREDYLLAGCDAMAAFNLRGQEKIEDALFILGKMSHTYDRIADQRAYAKLETALILSTVGRAPEALNCIDEAFKICPHYGYLKTGRKSIYQFPVFLALGKWDEAVNVLLADAHVPQGISFLNSMQMTQAGMILEIAGQDSKARDIYAEVTRRFPVNRCAFFADLAQDLIEHRTDKLFNVPSGAQQRSEMLYLGGLLAEKYGMKDSARFFEQAVQEDLSLRWPAWLSKKMMQPESGSY